MLLGKTAIPAQCAIGLTNLIEFAVTEDHIIEYIIILTNVMCTHTYIYNYVT